MHDGLRQPPLSSSKPFYYLLRLAYWRLQFPKGLGSDVKFMTALTYLTQKNDYLIISWSFSLASLVPWEAGYKKKQTSPKYESKSRLSGTRGCQIAVTHIRRPYVLLRAFVFCTLLSESRLK
jgi:hypothetical protein